MVSLIDIVSCSTGMDISFDITNDRSTPDREAASVFSANPRRQISDLVLSSQLTQIFFQTSIHSFIGLSSGQIRHLGVQIILLHFLTSYIGAFVFRIVILH